MRKKWYHSDFRLQWGPSYFYYLSDLNPIFYDTDVTKKNFPTMFYFIVHFWIGLWVIVTDQCRQRPGKEFDLYHWNTTDMLITMLAIIDRWMDGWMQTFLFCRSCTSLLFCHLRFLMYIPSKFYLDTNKSKWNLITNKQMKPKNE